MEKEEEEEEQVEDPPTWNVWLSSVAQGSAICSVLSKVDHQVLGSSRNHAVLRGGSTQQLLIVCTHKHYLPSV